MDAQRKLFPEGHPDVGITLHHMGSNFWRMKNYQQAIDSYQESLNILQQFMNPVHMEIALIQQKFQRLQQEQQNLSLQITK